MFAATAHPLVRSTNFADAPDDLRRSGRLRGGDRTVGALHPTARRLTPCPPVPSECLRSTHASIAAVLSVVVRSASVGSESPIASRVTLWHPTTPGRASLLLQPGEQERRVPGSRHSRENRLQCQWRVAQAPVSAPQPA